MAEAFYLPDGDRLIATELTRGPWHAQLQHAGPPSALLARAIARLGAPMQPCRITVDLLRPVPIAPLRVRCRITVDGRRRRIAEAALLLDADDTELAIARALLLRVAPVPAPAAVPPADREPLRGVADSAPYAFDFFRAEVGYHTAMELRLGDGGPGHGHALMWMRPRVALVAGEPIDPAARTMIVADSGNGVSAALDPRRFAFMNADLDVSFRRLPQGEWIGLQAATHVAPHGLAVAESRLRDTTGVFGSGLQHLLIEPVTAAN